MRVVILTSVHPHDDVRIFHKEARSLAAAGHEVFLLNAFASGRQGGVTLVQVPLPERRGERIALAWQRYATAALRLHPEVCHLHDPELIPAGLWLHSKKIAVIYDAHEDLPKQVHDKSWIPPALRGVAAGSAAVLERLAATQFDLIFCATELIAQRFAKAHNAVYALHNYPALAEFPPPDWEREREGAVCYVGAVTQKRGALEQVRAAYLAGVPLYLAGRVETPRLAKQLRRLNFGGNTKILGVLARTEVAELLARCRAGLVVLHPTPAYMQSIPIKMLEYMAAGLPVIASDFPHWRQLLHGIDCAVYVDPFNTQALADAMTALVNHPERARELGENGRHAVERRFCWERERGVLLRAYRRLEKERATTK